MRTSKEFLDLLNERVFFEDGEVRHRGRPGGWNSGSEVRDLFESNRKSFQFSQAVDVVFEPGCSHAVSEVSSLKPFGQYRYRDLTCETEKLCEGFFIDLIFEKNPEAKTILILTDCCGQFESSFQSWVCKEKPDVTWLFPHLPDFCSCMYRNDHVTHLVQCLIDANILSVTEVTVS